MMATLLAGGLGFGTHYLASLGGDTGRPIILALFVFILGILLLPPPQMFLLICNKKKCVKGHDLH